MEVKQIISYIEDFAPLSLQDSYDNAGLLIGNANQDVTTTLITIDVTEDIIDEAINLNCNFIIAHHPVIFNGLKKITGSNYTERIIQKAIKNDIAIYAVHTNIDNVVNGVNGEICNRLGLKNCRILQTKPDMLRKLVTFVPEDNIDNVRQAIFNAGAGHIGNYDCCSYNVNGYGTFRAGDKANRFVGEIGKVHTENEIRFETVFPKNLTSKIVQALISSHPYEEVAYDIYPLENKYNKAGAGMIGELEKEVDEIVFLKKIKEVFRSKCLKHTKLSGKPIVKVAVCGGSGSFLLSNAIKQNADIFISSDFKYHQFFDADKKIIIADIGHFESEQFTKDLIYDLLIKKFPKFALHLSKVNTNPINYL